MHGEAVADVESHGQQARWLPGDHLWRELAGRAADPAFRKDLDYRGSPRASSAWRFRRHHLPPNPGSTGRLTPPTARRFLVKQRLSLPGGLDVRQQGSGETLTGSVLGRAPNGDDSPVTPTRPGGPTRMLPLANRAFWLPHPYASKTWEPHIASGPPVHARQLHHPGHTTANPAPADLPQIPGP